MEEISAGIRAELEKSCRTAVFIVGFQIFTLLDLIFSIWFHAPVSQNSISQQSLDNALGGDSFCRSRHIRFAPNVFSSGKTKEYGFAQRRFGTFENFLSKRPSF